jgi:ZIP family zinc transporter
VAGRVDDVDHHVLTMLADTMLPVAVEHAGQFVGVLTVIGCAAAFLLSAA